MLSPMFERRPLPPSGLRRWTTGMLAAAAAATVVMAPQPNADACGWDYETYHAEAKKLPCVTDTLLGYTTPHTREYHQARVAAMDLALEVAPTWLDGLDTKGLSLMYLGELEQAEATLQRRHQLAPDAYAGHANLGTLYTFMGRFDEAQKHIEAAMKIEPDAHFGREGVHLALVKHLAAKAKDPAQGEKNFLGLELTQRDRTKGSPAKLEAAGFSDRDIDALVAMLTVYGAADHPDILFALGDLLALKGMKRLAWTAYRRARSAKHPATRTLYLAMKALDAALEKEWRAENPRAREGSYGSLGMTYGNRAKKGDRFRDKYQAWEREQLDAGLEVWTEAGITQLYRGIDEMRPRCKVAPVPGEAAQAVDDEPEAKPKSKPKTKRKPNSSAKRPVPKGK